MLKHMAFEKLTGTVVGNYHLERFIGQSKIGPAFLARTDTTTTYLVRFLDGPVYTTPGDQQVYLEQFQYRARQIATLQHPYIPPSSTSGSIATFPTWSRHTFPCGHCMPASPKMGR